MRELAGWPVTEVVLVSPHPPAECAQRLASATSRVGMRLFLAKQYLGRPEPQFRGAVTAKTVSIARFRMTITRGSFFARLRGTLHVTNEGGTRLTGAIWPAYSRTLGVAFLAGIALFLIGYEVIAVVIVAHAHLRGWPFLLLPVLLSTFTIMLLRSGLRTLRSDSNRLVEEVAAVLDADEPQIGTPRDSPASASTAAQLTDPER